MKNRNASARRRFITGLAATVATAAWAPRFAFAADPLKIGLILPLTGPFASTGRQIEAACRLYMARNGDTAAGRKVQLMVKDDTGLAPETTKRIAQEMVVQEHVTILAGFGLTPLALATAPVATEAKVPMIVMAAATSIIPQRSPFIVRSGFTLPQVTAPMADWASKNKVKKVVTLVTDYGPGLDAEKTFVKRFGEAGGTVVESLRTPLRGPDYGPFLQRVKDAKPDALFVFVPAGKSATALMKGFGELGLAQAGIKLIGPGDITTDEELPNMGDVALGVLTVHHYSAAATRPANKEFVAAWKKEYGAGETPNFVAAGAYDGAAIIVEAIKQQKGKLDPDKTMEIFKNWKNPNSPRGPIAIDPETRDIVQNEYLREVKRVDGQLANVEIETVGTAVKDPWKQLKK